MSEITIVTAVFDIGRGEWENTSRGVEKYLEYFKFWSRLRNNIVVYTSNEIGKEILKIRDQFDLSDRTKIVIIDDVNMCDNDIYHRIKNAMENKISQNFHRYPDRPESNNPDYNYLVLLKPFFVADAVKRNLASGMVAWLDFGYNHGGETYLNPEEFDYLWEYDFEDKLHLFALKQLDDTPIFHIVKTMDVYFAGGLMVGPDYLWNQFWQSFRNAMLNLTACGFADDDQTLILMAYRENPEIFSVHYIEDWLLPLKLFGGSHLTIREKKKKSLFTIYRKKIKKLCGWK